VGKLGRGKWEVGSGKWEVGSGKWEFEPVNDSRARENI